MIDPPTDKQIGSDFSVSLATGGSPMWTRLQGQHVNASLRPEEVRDLHYALTRIIAYLDAVEQ